MPWNVWPVCCTAHVLSHLRNTANLCNDAAVGSQLHDRQCFAGSLTELLDSDLGKAIIDLPEEQLFGMVLNDFYKPKMHKIYSALYTGVEADFQLKIRKTPFTLERIRNEARSSHCVMVA